MIDAILKTLQSMGILGIVIGVLTLANIVLGTVYSVSVCGDFFDIKKMFKGILKSIIIYIGAILLAIGVTILPIALAECGFSDLVKPEVLETFSITAIATIMIGTAVKQGLNAYDNLKKLLESGRNNSEE